MKLRIKPKIGSPTKKAQKSTVQRKRNKCTWRRVLSAIPDSGGTLSAIAKRLNTSVRTLQKALDKSGEEWADVRAELQIERDRIGDVAENTVQFAMRQRLDMSTASRTAKWYLERKHQDRGFREKKELTIEGGKNPLHIKSETFIRLDELNLDTATKKSILKAIEEKERTPNE